MVVPTHNDGPNMAPLLARLLAEPCVGDIVVVASACSDETAPRVREAVRRSSGRVQLYVEGERTGKAAAVNFGLRRLSSPFVVVVSGDVLPEPGMIGRLVEALTAPGVGLAGGRPIPVNSESTLTGHAVHLLWRLHHRLALRQPKLGEVIALRREAVVPLPGTSVDEACFQSLLEANGWSSAYVPEAVVANSGPGTIANLVKQRRRAHAGHLWLRRRQGYAVPSLHPLLLLGELARDHFADRRRLRPAALVGTATALTIEAWARLLARVDYLRGTEDEVWETNLSAKDLRLTHRGGELPGSGGWRAQ